MLKIEFVLRLINRLALSAILIFVFVTVSTADVRFASGKSALKIPFKLWNNHVYVNVRVNNSKPLWILLDTGARNIINLNQAKALGLELTLTGQALGIGENPVDVWSAENIAFAFPGVIYSNQKVGVLSLESVEECANNILVDPKGKITLRKQPAKGDERQPIDGVLGAEFFDAFVVEIDFANRFINLYDPKTYQYSGGGDAIPIEMSGIHIFVRASLTASKRAFPDARFLIDTGAVIALILNNPFVKKNNLLLSEQTAPLSICGIGGRTQTRVGTVENLRLKNFNVENPVTLFSQATNGILMRSDFDGIIGNAILRHFRVVFDYSRSRMILESSPKALKSSR